MPPGDLVGHEGIISRRRTNLFNVDECQAKVVFDDGEPLRSARGPPQCGIEDEKEISQGSPAGDRVL
jgi:hypothetical protein